MVQIAPLTREHPRRPSPLHPRRLPWYQSHFSYNSQVSAFHGWGCDSNFNAMTWWRNYTPLQRYSRVWYR